MENEKRLIDANAFIEDIKTEIVNLRMDGLKGTPRPCEELYDIIDRIGEQPTVDAVVLPCEIGCEVFYIWSVIDDNDVENFEMSIGKVASFSIQGDGVWAYCRYEDGLTFWHKVLDDFGRVVFLTREEAETALAKMDGDGNV